MELKEALRPFVDMAVIRSWLNLKNVATSAMEHANVNGLKPTETETEEAIIEIFTEQGLKIEDILTKKGR